MAAKCWYWKEGIPKEVCQLILNTGEQDRFSPGETRDDAGDEYRNNQIFFLDKNHWFEAVFWNDCEKVQISRYEPGQRYEWHADENIFRDSEAIRKLTVVCQINDPAEYQGGGLFLEGFDENILVNQGDVIVFPSIMRHTAKKVEQGQRVSAALWVTGPQFR
jgi:predicted 2-oxoglutarate/Fe(II)-dependent dioxygenase YbiX